MPITGFQLFDDWPIPYRVDPASRDATIRELRAAAGWLRRPGEPLLLVGDWDVTEREPAYNDLTYGLYDAQALVGTGAGNTWRPGRFKGLPFGLLRIDYLLSTPAIVPLQTWVDCAPRGSDHCILSGRFAVEPDANRRLTATDRSPIR
jgi:exonuclease III